MILLDIGAGYTEFGKELRKLNPAITTVICGDPYIKKDFEGCTDLIDLPRAILYNLFVFQSRFNKVLSQKEITEVIVQSKKGVFKIVSRYEDIQLPDESVDIVTLNSPHPLTPPYRDDFNEFARVLKKGGIFYYGHSIDITHQFDENTMSLVGEGRFSHRGNQRGILPDYNLVFPMSPVIESNVFTQYLQEKGHQSSNNYIYKKGGGLELKPSWKAWIKK